MRFMPDYGFAHNTDDIDWITRLGAEPSANWIVVTGDQRIRKNIAERKAWIQAGLKAFRAGPCLSENTRPSVLRCPALAMARNGEVHIACSTGLDVRDVNQPQNWICASRGPVIILSYRASVDIA